MVFSSCAAAVILTSAAAGSPLELTRGASITVPTGIRIEHRGVSEQERVYHLYSRTASVPFLSGHVGLHPAFPYCAIASPDWAPADGAEVKRRVRRVDVEGRQGQETKWDLPDGSHGRERIVYLGDGVPPVIHFFYRGLKGWKRKAADAVIASLHIQAGMCCAAALEQPVRHRPLNRRDARPDAGLNVADPFGAACRSNEDPRVQSSCPAGMSCVAFEDGPVSPEGDICMPAGLVPEPRRR